MVELGRIDIATEVSMLPYQNDYPRKEHFVAALYIMYYLKGKHNSCLDLDPTYPTIVYENFETKKYWTDFYRDVKETIPLNAPMPLGKSVDLQMIDDSDHAGENTTRRSCTGFMIFVNMDSITCLSKKQTTVRSAVFGSDFFAMKHRVIILQGLG